MTKQNITEKGQFINTTNYEALINAQANTPTFLDNKSAKQNIKIETTGKKLSKTIGKSSQRHR